MVAVSGWRGFVRYYWKRAAGVGVLTFALSKLAARHRASLERQDMCDQAEVIMKH